MTTLQQEYICSPCKASFPDAMALIGHVTTEHNREEVRWEHCRDCGVVLDDPADPAVQGCAAHRGFEHRNLEPAWTTEQARGLFEFIGFAYGMASVKRRSDGARGTLEFQHAPRYYFDFTAI